MKKRISSETGFFLVTETPGQQATREQLARLYQRYRFAADFCRDKSVLEVACGSGIGLGYLAKVAREVYAGDVDVRNIDTARKYYAARKEIQISIFDAHHLPFPSNSFDVVILHEAIYYLENPKKFISEASRILKQNGVLIIATVNKDWPDFHPSSFTHRYFPVPELNALLQTYFPEVCMFGGFPVDNTAIINRLYSFTKQLAVRLHLIPRTLKGRVVLKRIFTGSLVSLPAEITENMISCAPPNPIDTNVSVKNYKIIYCVARKAMGKG